MAGMRRHRTDKNYTKLYRSIGGFTTLVFVLSLVIALLPQVPLQAAAQQESFQHWLNDNGNWATGAINAQNSTYAEGDVIPHWIEWTNATVGGTATFAFSYEWQDASGHTGHDYLDDVNETENASLVTGLSGYAIPPDSEVVSQLGAQPPGQFLYRGFTVNSVSLETFDHGDREDKYYTFTVTFTEAEAHLYYGAHLARASQWSAGGASSFSGGNLENRFDRDGIGVGSSADQTRSIQVNAIGPEPPPGVDVEKATNGEDADTGTGPQIVVGGQVDWTYVVTNTGNVALTGVVVADDQGVSVSCPATTLAVGASMTCTASGTAVAGQYVNVGSVTTDQDVSDSDPSHYFGRSTPTTTTTTTAPSLGSIGDFVWDDGVITEANGIQNAGELGVGGITVNLYDGSGTTKLASRVTDNSGKYLFAGLSSGSYLVEFVIPNGSPYSFVPGNPGGPDSADSDADRVSGRSGTITLSAGQDDLSWDAGLITSAVLPQVITTTTTSTPLEVLPFTGSSQGGAGIIGLILLMLGGLALSVAGRRKADLEVVGNRRTRS